MGCAGSGDQVRSECGTDVCSARLSGLTGGGGLPGSPWLQNLCPGLCVRKQLETRLLFSTVSLWLRLVTFPQDKSSHLPGSFAPLCVGCALGCGGAATVDVCVAMRSSMASSCCVSAGEEMPSCLFPFPCRPPLCSLAWLYRLVLLGPSPPTATGGLSSS